MASWVTRIVPPHEVGESHVADHNEAERLQKIFLQVGATKDSVFENRVAPDGTVTRHVRRDVVRKAASAPEVPA